MTLTPALSQGRWGEAGDPAILELPEHTKGLGQPVVARAYGSPSQFIGVLVLMLGLPASASFPGIGRPATPAEVKSDARRLIQGYSVRYSFNWSIPH